METVTCTTVTGKLVEVPATEVTFSPASYGILIENRRVMLEHHPATGLWHPPGGRLAEGQTPERGVRAYFRSATGFLPELTALLHIEEQHWLDEAGRAWHLSLFYYGLRRAMGSSVGLAGIAQERRPEWVSVQTLTREEMQFGFTAVQVGARRQAGV